MRRNDVEASRRNGVQLPSSIDELRWDLKQEMFELATSSVEFREWMVKPVLCHAKKLGLRTLAVLALATVFGG